MNIDNLHFFDNNGYNLNFQKNKNGYWEGTIYLPKVSVGLYANTTIYILEEISSLGDSLSPNNDNLPDNLGQITTEYCFPKGTGKIVFMWDQLNTFVDEFFMFNFDDTYTIKETSSLVYTPNDGPDCNTLIINKFDRYEIPLDNTTNPKALPVHVAFMANEKYDANTYNRTLVMTYNNETIARIKFYVETEEEDERLKIWNANLGYNITPEDTMIFYKSDIKEYRPDYMLLNEKRKELMMEGSNIYPYIGSYLAIINAIKFFGYDNLNIIEYWRCVNPSDENFGKIYHSSRYSLTKKETLRIGATNIILPNKDYKKINALALVYDINKPTGEIDKWELPLVQEQFRYTIEEALIKLFALRKKLNKEFMPGNSRIIDIIGEANYFGLHGIRKIHQDQLIDVTTRDLNLDFEVYPKKHVHITDNEYFNRYILIKQIRKSNAGNSNLSIGEQLLSDISNLTISSIRSERSEPNPTVASLNALNNSQKCAYFENYYKDVYEDYTVYKAIENNDFYPFEGDEYDYYNDSHLRFTAKVILKSKLFENPTFGNTELKFDCKYNDIVEEGGHSTIPYGGTYQANGSNLTFGNIDQLNRPQNITWTITRSKDQHDDDLKNAGIVKEYDTTKQFTVTKTGSLNTQVTYSEIFIELPYLGYYDVTLDIDGQKKTKTKCIKVEPYNIDMIGFYYDIRNLPKKLQYNMTQDDAMFNFIQENIRNMTGWAVSERTSLTVPSDFSMPTYTANGEMINTGPYFNENIDDEWYLADNLTYEIARLIPLVKYTRYIRSGVDVKPYTWFLLGYEYSKIAGKINPHWTIKNNESTDDPKEYDGRYLTLLLKKEGNYTVTLDLEDKNGNKYSISRNIIVVSKSANYKLYQPFKNDYDVLIEQDMLRELNEFYADDKESGDDDTPEYEEIDVDVTGKVSFENDYINVDVTGYVDYDIEMFDVDVEGTVSFEIDHYDVDVEGIVIGTTPVSVDVTIIPNTPIPVTIDGTISETEVVPVNIDASISGSETVPVSIDGSIIKTDTVPVDVEMTVSESEIVPVGVEASLMESETVPVNLDITVSENENIPVNIDATVMSTDIIPVNVDVAVSGQDVVSTNIDATVIESDVISTNIDATLLGQDIVPVNIDVTIDEEENE